MRIENWFPVFGEKIGGAVYDRPGVEDGTTILTSHVHYAEERDGKLFVQTHNSVYELGAPDAEFAQDEPEWKAHFLEHFSKGNFKAEPGVTLQ